MSLAVAALGATVRIDIGALAEPQRALVAAAWADAAVADEGSEDAVVTPLPDVSEARMLEDLSQRVTLAAIEARRGELWMLHAAGLARDDGTVVALVGPSGRGKTTAARMLGRSFGYVSDETVAVDADGRVWPYRKPLSVIERAGEPKVQRAPSEAGMRALPAGELRLAAIVLLDRRDDAEGEPLIEEVDLGDALAELVEQSSYLADMATPLRTMAGVVAAVGGVRRVSYREAEGLVAVVGSAGGFDTGAARVPASGFDTAASRPTQPAGVGVGYYRGRVRDWVELDDPDRIAVLQVDEDGDGTVRVLAGVAPELWRAATGASLDELVAAAVDAYGTPEDKDAAAAVSAAVDELVTASVLEFREARWRIREDVAWTGEEDRVVALALTRPDAQPAAMEGSAAEIWLALAEGEAGLDEVAVRIAGRAEISVAGIAGDVAAFLTALAAADLVEAR
ncbi:ATP-binding protein [Microbacterium terricola]|uniref:ATP-binding protein n=1 Tax=Microbacterium terricola TaxID=344163 RepID=UPI0021E7EDA5|nr:PqqD family peptide modification chaperone [Microbacterium terricola]UYK39507.1 hypothetical protein OAU46_12480 [Microbacterium terricola]